MLDVPSSTISQRVETIVKAFVKDLPVVPRSQNLQEIGLTSMDMVNLMLSIEAEFDVTIPAQKLVPGNFKSIDSIETLLRDIAR